MFKFLAFIVFLGGIIQQQSVHTEDYSGSWEGAISIHEQELKIELTFSFSAGELDGTINIPQQFAYNLPVEVLTATADSLVFQFQTGTGAAVFKGQNDGSYNHLKGEFFQSGMQFPFFLNRENGSEINRLAAFEEELNIPGAAGNISGSLLLAGENQPLVVMISGSGSQNRDANVAGFALFRELSSAFYEQNISSFRYDDRGVGGSDGEADATLQDLAEDVHSIVRYLREHYGESISNIILYGHSQGGLVASITAEQTDADGIIYAAAPFVRGDKIINDQIRALSAANDVSDEILEQNLNFQERIYDIARNDGSWDGIEKELYGRLESQINQLPEQQRAGLGDMNAFIESQINQQLSAAKTRWFTSMIEYEPASFQPEKSLPRLALFGEKDIQVGAELNETIVREVFESCGDVCEIATIPGANHLFQKAESGMPAEYPLLEKKFAEGFSEAMFNWIERHF